MNSHNRKSHRGVAMVEFAIVLPLLLAILLGVTELGRAIYQDNILHKAVEAGARYLARREGYIPNPETVCSASADTSYEQDARDLIIAANQDGGVPNLTINFTVMQRTATENIDGDTVTTTACFITVDATAPFVSLFDTVVPFTGITLPFSISAVTEERYIGY